MKFLLVASLAESLINFRGPLIAALQAQEVVKLLTGVGRPLNSQLLYFDLEYNLFEKIHLK